MSSAEISMSRKAVIHQQRRVFDDFFKIDDIVVSHERRDGTMSAKQKQLVFERGDSVAVLLFNRDTKSVVLVEQFRAAAMVRRRRDDPATTNGWIVETVAIRETMEETGYRIRDPQLIGKVFASPGGSSERVFVYFAEVGDADRQGKGGGVDGEDVEVVHMPLADLFAHLAQKSIEDAKLLIAAYWLENYLKASEALQR
jgi:nudix-type nucleoside diphosphatase (YffH/AdpP family)